MDEFEMSQESIKNDDEQGDIGGFPSNIWYVSSICPSSKCRFGLTRQVMSVHVGGSYDR
jgi:hypothetical protein